MITITNEEFIESKGIDLSDELRGYSSDSKNDAIESVITSWTKTVYKEANKRSVIPIPDDDDLTENQKTIIKESICDYGLFVLKRGDLKSTNGLTENGYEAIFPEYITEDLQNVGLIRRSLKKRW